MKALKIAITIGVIALISFCFLNTADAQVKWNKYSYFKNWAGLNDNLSSTEIEDNEASDILNIIFDTGGALRKRFGYLTIPNNSPYKVATGTTVCVNGITFFKKDNGNRYLVVLANNDSKATLMEKDYDANGGPEAGAWKNITNAGLASSYTNNYQPSFAIASDSVIVVDGVNTSKPYRWSGSGKATILTTDADLPNGNILCYHKNQLFIAGNDTFPSRIFFSNLDDISTWDPLDFFDVQTADGSKVTGMISTLDSLYIFKDKSIWRLAGSTKDDFVLQKLVDGIGTLSGESIKVVNNAIYFITPQNDVAIYDGAYNVQFASQKIRGTIGGLAFNRAANARGLAFSSYKYNDFDYYVSTSTYGATSNNKVLLFDTAYKAWTKFDGINANCWTVGDDPHAQNIVYFGDYSGYVNSYPSTRYYDGNIATSAIVSYYQSKWFKYSDAALGDKYWRLLKTYCLSENSDTYLNAACRSDFEASGKVVQVSLQSSQAQWDSALWDKDVWGGSTIIVGRSEIEKGTNMFQVKFYNNNVNEGYTIVGYENFIEGSERI